MYLFMHDKQIIYLMVSMQDKYFSRQQLEIFLLFFLETRLWHFMQADNLHEISKCFLVKKKKKKKNIVISSSAEFVQIVLRVKTFKHKHDNLFLTFTTLHRQIQQKSN